MYTRNFYNRFFSLFDRHQSGINSKYYTLRTSEGNIYQMGTYQGSVETLFDCSNVLTRSSGSVGDIGIAFGNGTADPTIEDYRLDGEYIPNIIITSKTSTHSTVNGVQKTIQRLVVRNDNDTEITISEVGIIIPVYRYSNSSSASQYNVLSERYVLDTPLTLAPGATGIVQITRDFPLPAGY